MDSVEPHVISVDRMDDGAVVSFGDGRTAFFSAALLYATLPQAREMPSNFEDGWLTVGQP